MYRIFYGDKTIFDPYGNENEVVSDASLSANLNASAYLDFKMAINHPLYKVIAEKADIVKLLWDDNVLFEGQIESIDIDIKGTKSVSCVSALDYLNDTIVRPYSTIKGESDLTAPSSVDGYFQWLIDQHNKHVKDSNKLFYIGVNQGANLQRNNFIYRSSTNNPTTASEISNQIIDSLGGYLLMRYEDGRHILDLYSDVHTMNAQIIDFGVNLKDFSKKIDTNDQYTALIAKGGSPQFMNGGFESGDFSYWESHPDTAIVTDKAQEGSYSSYVIEGIAKYVPASFFYAKKNGRYKSTVYVKNERPSNVVIHAGYQTNVLDSWSNDSKTVPFTIPNDDQWHECSYEFSTGVENNTKIRPYWYSDNISNSGNSRVYFDGFEFSRLIGNNTVSEDPIDLTLIPNGGTRYDSDIIKSEDVIYNPNRVSRYGYREKVFTDSTITNVEDLMQAAIKELNKLAEPTIGLDVKAIDLALYMDRYTHLNVGDAVRVRSAIHNTDEYLMVSSINLNLQDPENSEYVIGQAYDSLTGQQSGYLRSLSAGINSSLDAVASLDQTTKDQAIKIGSVTEATKKAQDTADSASSKADNAQQSANTAQQTANANKEQINAVKDKQSEHDALIEQAKKDIAASEAEISGINDRMTQMDSDIDKAQSDIDATRTETNTIVQNVRDSVSKTQSDVDAVAKKASDLSDDLDATKATVSQTVTEFGEVRTTATNAVSKADQSLQVSTQASQTATSASQKATSAYNDAQTAITKSSEAVQTANSVSLSLKTDYQTKADADAKYATQASLTATSDQIKTEVSKTYATKATVNALENIANNAVQTWMGKGAPTLKNKPASDWNTAALKTQHSGDIYYDTDTGYSYRFGSSDGSTYSWALIKDTDISKAIADAAKAQKTADSATSGVSELKSSIPVTYATKTELTQKADSITSRVEEVAQAGTTTSSKVTQLEQTASEFQSTVTEQSRKLDQQATTISQVSQRVDSVSSTISQVSGTVDALSDGLYDMVLNGGFEDGVAHWSTGDHKPSVDTNQHHTGFKSLKTVSGQTVSIINDNEFVLKRGHTYRWSAWLKAESSITTGLYPKIVVYNGSSWDTDDVQVFLNITVGTSWTQLTHEFTIGEGYSKGKYGFGIGSNNSPIYIDDCSLIDVTDLNTVESTANSALSQSSTVQQDLSSFKTTVAQTYESKNDARTKQSALTQTIDGFKTEVSQTYTTKNDFNNASSTTNMWPNQWFDTSKPLIGRAPVGSEIEAAPVGGNIRIIEQRDNASDSVSSSITPGRKYKITVDAKRVSGGNYLQGGIWYTSQTSGNSYDGYAGAFSVTKDLGNSWHRYEKTVTVPNGKQRGTAYFQIGDGSKWKISNLRFEDVTDIADIQANYSTKSYVDQTSRTVSLGVVEEYKKGQHGSALATQSDISVAKDSITSTVSQTYLSKNDASVQYATKTQVQQASDSLTVKIGNILNSPTSDNLWPNQWFDDDKPLLGSPGTEKPPSGGKSRLLAGRDHFNPSVMASVCPGHHYRITADAKRTAGSLALRAGIWYTKETLGTPFDSCTDSTSSSSLGNDWNRYTWEVTIPSGKQAGSLYFRLEQNDSGGSTEWLVGNAVLQDITAAYDAQSIANAASSNAANAQNRVGNLETCIKMTTDGVRVGKIDNGNFSGYSALVNSNGSFDILDSGGKRCSSFNQNTIKLGENNNDSIVDMGNGTVKFYGSTDSKALNINTRDKGPITINGYDLGLIGRSCLLKQTRQTTAQTGRFVNVPMEPAYINTKGQCATRIEPFTQDGDGVRINVKGLYLISLAGIPIHTISTDIVRLSLDSTDGCSYIMCQYAAVEEGNMMSHTEMRILDAKTYHLTYKCDQGGGSIITGGFVTLTFMGYLE